MIIYVLMLIYHEYCQIQNNDLQLKLKDDYRYDESIVLYDVKILILLIYEQSEIKKRKNDFPNETSNSEKKNLLDGH